MEKSQSLNTKSKIRSIEEAGFGRRMIAMIMDAVVFAFVMVALALWVCKPIVNSALDYEQLGVKALRYEVFSKTYIPIETLEDNSQRMVEMTDFDTATGTMSYIPLYNYEDDDVEFYKERLHYYYCNYKTGKDTITMEGKDPEEFKSPDYNILIKDNNGNEVYPVDYYTEAWFASLIEGKTTVQDYKNLAYEAVKDLYNSDYFQKVNNEIKKCQLLMILPAFLVSYLGFYFLAPMLFKNGETLGKKVMKIGLISKDGFSVRKRQIVFRQLLLLLWISFCSFIVGIGLTSLATLGLGVFIYLIATFISKTKRSPMDYAALTYMIDTDKSVWFKDAKEEEQKEIELDEKMSKYRKYEPDQSHVIQVGTEIVNEDVKKELEEENLKKIKK